MDCLTTGMDIYFNRVKNNINKVLRVFRSTPYGSKLRLPEHVDSYNDFVRIPLMSSGTLIRLGDDLLIKEPDVVCFYTSGTTGVRKKIYRALSPPFLEEELLRGHVCFIHTYIGEPHIGEYYTYYSIHDEYFRRKGFSSIVAYKDLLTLVNALNEQYDVIFVYDCPAGVMRFLFFVEKAIREGLLSPNILKRADLIIKITGEPISISTLRQIYNRARRFFDTIRGIYVTYGTSEIGLIGVYKWRKHDALILYRIVDDVFVEIIGKRNLPLKPGKPGEIVVTPLRTKGTILMRYRTGDIGYMILKNKFPLLYVKGRHPKFEYVYVAGGQFSLRKLAEELVGKFRLPLKLTASRYINEKVGEEVVRIDIYIPEEGLKIFPRIKEYCLNRVSHKARITSQVEIGQVKIEIRPIVKTGHQRKSWMIKRNP